MPGGLLARLIHFKNQKPTKQCDRCGLRYSYEDNEKCPHCGSLTESELTQLKEKIESEQAGSHRLGVWFLVAAIGIIFLMLVISAG